MCTLRGFWVFTDDGDCVFSRSVQLLAPVLMNGRRYSTVEKRESSQKPYTPIPDDRRLGFLVHQNVIHPSVAQQHSFLFGLDSFRVWPVVCIQRVSTRDTVCCEGFGFPRFSLLPHASLFHRLSGFLVLTPQRGLCFVAVPQVKGVVRRPETANTPVHRLPLLQLYGAWRSEVLILQPVCYGNCCISRRYGVDIANHEYCRICADTIVSFVSLALDQRGVLSLPSNSSQSCSFWHSNKYWIHIACPDGFPEPGVGEPTGVYSDTSTDCISGLPGIRFPFRENKSSNSKLQKQYRPTNMTTKIFPTGC